MISIEYLMSFTASQIKQPMKIKISLSLLLLFSSATAFCQILTPIKWSYAAKKTGVNTATLYLKATIDEGWHLYSQFVKDGGPVKTTFTFPTSKDYIPVGKVTEPKPITHFEKTFGMDVRYFERSVIFQQKIKLKGKNATVKGAVEYMVCNDKQCLPPDEVQFSMSVK